MLILACDAEGCEQKAEIEDGVMLPEGWARIQTTRKLTDAEKEEESALLEEMKRDDEKHGYHAIVAEVTMVDYRPIDYCVCSAHALPSPRPGVGEHSTTLLGGGGCFPGLGRRGPPLRRR